MMSRTVQALDLASARFPSFEDPPGYDPDEMKRKYDNWKAKRIMLSLKDTKKHGIWRWNILKSRKEKNRLLVKYVQSLTPPTCEQIAAVLQEEERQSEANQQLWEPEDLLRGRLALSAASAVEDPLKPSFDSSENQSSL